MMEQSYEKTLRHKAASFRASSHPHSAGLVGWSCPSNIAIVKYWGKKAGQVPMNPSLSLTLKEARTSTYMEYIFDPETTLPEIQFQFEGEKAPVFEDRVRSFIRSIEPFVPAIAHTTLRIESHNTFPHSSGIASSASSMGALAMCLVQIDNLVCNTEDADEVLRKASFIARLGSGSASRSIYPQFVIWGASDDWDGSSDEYAIPVNGFHETFNHIRDTILIVESGPKRVSSRKGHALMEQNPFSKTRFRQARSNLGRLKPLLVEGNWDGFIELMEEEALSLHAMMMTGRPGYLLMQPGTISIIKKVRKYRQDTGCRIGFTLDAGANVHLLYPHGEAEPVHEFIASELVPFCEQGRYIQDRMGKGPAKL